MAKMRNSDSFWAAFLHFCPDERKIWHGGPLSMPNLTFMGATSSPMRGEKPIFGPMRLIPALLRFAQACRYKVACVYGLSCSSKIISVLIFQFQLVCFFFQ